MSVVARLAALAGAMCLTGCISEHGPATNKAVRKLDMITVSVGPCFGFCPVYHASITPSGTVSFSGERHTTVIGDRTRDEGTQAYQAIAADLAPFRPAAGAVVAIECAAAVSDTSTWAVTWTDKGGRQATATIQQGCPGGPAQKLGDILKNLPQRLGISDWSRQMTRPGEGRG